MKLPDFRSFEPLNSAKGKMGIARNVYGNLTVLVAPGRLTLTELTKIESREGLDVSIEEIVVLPDGTLGFKGQRVVLYIRDKPEYGSYYSDPRFHLANCSTLKQMRHSDRFGKYVASGNTTGEFAINFIKGGKARPTVRRLSVCQNCLDYLRFGAFSLSQAAMRRQAAVIKFSIRDFFEKYPKSYHAEVPKHSEYSQPINNYTSGFHETSIDVRERAGWRCQEYTCMVDLSAPVNRKYLHTHHKNALKYDNSIENLIALCVYCHANTPNHSHIRNSPDYKAFVPIRLKLLRGS